MKDTDYVICEKTPLRFSSWVCLGSLNRSSPTLDDSPRTYQTALPQPFVAFLSPLTYQRLFRIRCGVATSILTESFDGVSIQFVSPTRKRSSTRFSLRGSHQVSEQVDRGSYQLVSEPVFYIRFVYPFLSFCLCQFVWKKYIYIVWVVFLFCSCQSCSISVVSPLIVFVSCHFGYHSVRSLCLVSFVRVQLIGIVFG